MKKNKSDAQLSTKSIDERRQLYFETVYNEGIPLLDWNFATAGHMLVQLLIDGKIKRDETFLDIGVGPGNEAVFVAKQGLKVSAIDINPKALEIAKKLAELQQVNIKFYLGDALSLPFEDESFDVVNDTFVFHHFEKNIRQDYAKEILRVLKPGGLFILRGFSNRMTPGSGPFRLSGNEILEAFMPFFDVEHLSLFKNVPTVKRPDQWHWFGLFRKVK